MLEGVSNFFAHFSAEHDILEILLSYLMQETFSRKGDVENQETSVVSQPIVSSRDRWYGLLLVIGGGGAFVFLTGCAVWWGYFHVYLPTQKETVSIGNISRETLSGSSMATLTNLETAPETDTVKVGESVSNDEGDDIKQVAIAVLNGGGVKGSAASVTALLKKEGYQNVTPGNTQKDYTGITIYFASGKERVANEIKKILLKQYPKTISKGAVEADKETSSSPIVVIFGK